MTPAEAEHIIVLDTDQEADAAQFAQLSAMPSVTVLDSWPQQVAALAAVRPTPSPALLAESARWVYYPWRRTLVKLLGPQSFRALRLDRNRNLVTPQEQERLGRLRIGIVGLSSGHCVAHTLAMSGFCGELRLTDFDDLEISNLNRVPATVFDLGVNKAVVASRRISELNPYMPISIFSDGLSPTNMSEFIDGLDIVVEQCDSLEVKLQLRQEARKRGIPVLMATSDRGLIDVERFDIDPERPVFHGLLGGVSAETMAGLSTAEKMPYVLQVFDPEHISARMGASMLEIGHTLAAWPQLAGEITVGAATVTEAVRRIGLGLPLPSGRTQVDVGAILDRIAEPGLPAVPRASEDAEEFTSEDVTDLVIAAAVRAPSGGNSQPWHIHSDGDRITIAIDPQRTSTMDIGFRGSATAIGAAAFNAAAAAAAHGRRAEISFAEPGPNSPLTTTLQLSPGTDPDRARWYPAVLQRQTNRHHGSGSDLPHAALTALTELAEQHGARLHVMTDRGVIAEGARLLAAADRIRYLDPQLHREMSSEMRWPDDTDRDFGIDVHSLELDAGSLAALALLRRGDVMAELDDWDTGGILGEDTRRRVLSSGALATVVVTGDTLCDYARGGGALAAVWTAAHLRGLAAHPVSPVFLYAHNHAELNQLSAKRADQLQRLHDEFNALVGKQNDESIVLSLRISKAPAPSVSSRRSAVFANPKR